MDTQTSIDLPEFQDVKPAFSGPSGSASVALEIVAEAIETYNPTHVFGLFSGGHDSLCANHIASQHPRFSGCVHINTGIGIDETREYVRETCRRFGWPLKEYRPPVSYEELVIDQGFPGPAMHWKMYQRLKERCLEAVMREHGERRRKLVFVSGRRAQESVRRMANCKEAIEMGPKPSTRAIWCNPIIAWNGCDKNRHIAAHDLPRNPVVELMCMSGECLCGAFAQPNELDEIRLFYPRAAAEIDRIADKVRAAGKHCVWGTRPPTDDPNQTEFPFGPMCHSCAAKRERAMSTQNDPSSGTAADGNA